MQLSIITDEITQDLSAAVAFAKAYKLQGLELRTLDNLPLEAMGAARLKEIKHVCDEEGLEISNLASSFFKCLYAERAGEIEKLKRLLEAADILDCQTLRGFAFFAEEGLEQGRVVEAFEQPLALLRDAGKQLLLESDPSVYTTNHAALRSLLDQIGAAEIGAIYDPGNDIYDPLGEKPYPDGFEQIQPYVRHVHIKDAILGENGAECVCIGMGLVDYKGVLRALTSSGYAGYLSLETHYRKGHLISEELMRLPGGSSFSEGGLEAAAESVAALRSLLGEE